jgi:ElaB/YqjD/DUF883 family membrane-anchored ribosome-binding protein
MKEDAKLQEGPEPEEIKDKAKDVKEDVGALTAETMVALRKSVEDLSARISANAVALGNRGASQLKDLKETIRREPLQSVAFAACFGLIVGLWRRRSLDR